MALAMPCQPHDHAGSAPQRLMRVPVGGGSAEQVLDLPAAARNKGVSCCSMRPIRCAGKGVCWGRPTAGLRACLHGPGMCRRMVRA
jgi:hypothetical protein